MTKLDYRRLNQVSFGKRIRKRRKELGMTLEGLAEVIDSSSNFIGNVENGKKGISLQNFIILCQALDISADSLLFDVEDHDDNAKSSTVNENGDLNYNHKVEDIIYDKGGKYGYGGEFERDKLISWIIDDLRDLDIEALRIICSTVAFMSKSLKSGNCNVADREKFDKM